MAVWLVRIIVESAQGGNESPLQRPCALPPDATFATMAGRRQAPPPKLQ